MSMGREERGKGIKPGTRAGRNPKGNEERGKMHV